MARVGSDWLGKGRLTFGDGVTSATALRWLLDASIGITIGAAFEGVAPPDVLFHVVWTLLILHAFASPTLRPVVIRVAIAVACLVSYWEFPIFAGYAPLDFAEWPLMLLMVAIVAIMAERRRTTSVRYAKLYRLSRDRLLTAQESERKHLAQNLHDGVGQSLSSLALTLEAAQAHLPAGTPAGAKLIAARELVVGATEETRNVAGRLQPPRLAQRGLASTLRELAGRGAMPVGMNIDPEAVGALSALPGDTQLHIYRVAQEILSNAQRHSGASRLLFTVRRLPNRIEVAGADDGRGFDPSRGTDRGLGLDGMRDRAEAIGARLILSSEVGRGTTVRLIVPSGDAPTIRGEADVSVVQVTQ